MPALIELLQTNASRCVPAAAARALERIGTPQALAVAKEIRPEKSIRL